MTSIRTKPRIAVLSGAGISAESGIRTFRDAGGLWEEHDIMDVASPMGWAKNPGLVLDFYNQRRRQLAEVDPNPGHLAIARLELAFHVDVITQNVDDLHERAGSTHVLHLHGELKKVRSTKDPSLVYPCEDDIVLGESCSMGSQLRPDIVWFGEMVPKMDDAVQLVARCDHLIVVGTSLNVYPAASLLHYVPAGTPRYLIDPNPAEDLPPDVVCYAENASTGVPRLADRLFATVRTSSR